MALESKKIAYESHLPFASFVWLGMLGCYASKAASGGRPQEVWHKCPRIMCRVSRRHTQKHCSIPTDLEAKLGIWCIMHYFHSRVLRYYAWHILPVCYWLGAGSALSGSQAASG